MSCTAQLAKSNADRAHFYLVASLVSKVFLCLLGGVGMFEKRQFPPNNPSPEKSLLSLNKQTKFTKVEREGSPEGGVRKSETLGREPRPVTIWLRCPRCRTETAEHVDWNKPPRNVKCDRCDRLIPFDLWKVVALNYGGTHEVT